MIAEAAMTLVKDTKGPDEGQGGVTTPAPAMGEALISRLRDHAGLRFEIEKG